MPKNLADQGRKPKQRHCGFIPFRSAEFEEESNTLFSLAHVLTEIPMGRNPIGSGDGCLIEEYQQTSQ